MQASFYLEGIDSFLLENVLTYLSRACRGYVCIGKTQCSLILSSILSGNFLFAIKLTTISKTREETAGEGIDG